ncbi:MAG: succinyl-diaminopimelate desuccinylase [Alphaproteobacteria bacterium]
MLSSAISIAQALIQRPSVTPQEAGTLDFIEDLLKPRGFQTTRHLFGDVDNLFARVGACGPHLCFVGHVDVVPVGDEASWSVPPFAGVIQDQHLWGRGAADMKGAIACFLAAVTGFLEQTKAFEGSISLLLTSDEEGPAVDGIQRLIPWLQENQHIPDLFLIGEPTGLGHVGTEMKIGRRGSLTGGVAYHGKQGHIAYPHLADNPIPRLLACLQDLLALPLDKGTAFFEPSRLEVTSIDVDNPVTNIIPAQAQARFGIRFNTEQRPELLSQKIEEICKRHGESYTLELTNHGCAFLTQAEKPIAWVSQAVEQVIGKKPALSTSGGTSDGRFLTILAPVIELGLPEDTIHQVDERVALKDLEVLTQIYHHVLTSF